MSKSAGLGDPQVILSYIREVMDRVPALPEPFTTSSLETYKSTVELGRELFPLRYQKPYIDVLDQAVKQATSVLQTFSPRATAKRQVVFQQLQLVFSTLAAPIVQLNSQHGTELKAFLTLISDVYRRFTDNTKIKTAAKTKLLWPLLDPLGSFGHDDSGPYTLAPSADLPVALVSKPASQMKFLPLWLADGHEVGGHSIYASVDGLENELKKAVEAALKEAVKAQTVIPQMVTFNRGAGSYFANKRLVSLVDFMVSLWRQWLPEVLADAAGVLNMGPMFIDGQMLIFALGRPSSTLSRVCVYDGKRGFSEHPPDVLRILLAVEVLKCLPFSRAQEYATALNRRLASLQGGSLPKTISFLSPTGHVATEVDLATFLAVVPAVARALVETRLEALSNQSLTEIMTWSDIDERATARAAKLLLRGRTCTDDWINARHIVAASLLALEMNTQHADFAALCTQVHEAGIKSLQHIYESQCLLSSVDLGPGVKEPETVSLLDLVRLVKSMRGR